MVHGLVCGLVHWREGCRLRVGFSRFSFYFFIITLKRTLLGRREIMFIFASHCNVFVVALRQPHSKGPLILVLLIV